MNRKILVLSVLLALLMLSGVSFAQEAAPEDALLIWADGERAPLLTELGAQFEEEFGIPVVVQEIGLGDARDQLLIAGPAGEGPDILISAHDSVGQFVANGAILPLTLDEEQAAEFTASSLNLFTYQGQLWGIPYAQENIALVRNVNLVPEAPATWQEVRALTEQFQAEGTADYAFVVQTGNTYHNFPITSAFGGYIFGLNEDGSFNVADVGLNSEGGLAAAEWLSGMYTDGLMPPDVNDDVAFEFFTNGDAAMFVTGPWFSSRIVEAAEAGGFEYSIDPLPGAEGGMEVGSPFSGGQGFVISAFSDKALEAETFLLDFVATTEFMQAIFDQGGRPSAFVSVDTSADPNVAAFNAAGANAIPMPAIPEMGTVWGASDQALTAISLGENATDAMNNAVVLIQDAIQLAQSGSRVVTLVGSLQDEAGCAGDWDPACEATVLTDEDGDGVFTGTFTLPAGDYEYKIAINQAWTENYGAEGAKDGANIALSLAAETEVTFMFDDSGETKVITDSVNNPS
ncbi:MAG: extracellular solute-binding protein [Anaerolineae bacterium]|jgi:maltose-binding protein MalE|nr:extracellular solute-binding protein [Anaerolineae bacterium]